MMVELALKQPELVGRDNELNTLRQNLDDALSGKSSTLFISGEAGIGKTRLVSELIREADSKDVQIVHGWCLSEGLEPLLPIMTGLRQAGLFHLISGEPPPLVVSAYLMNEAGMLIAKVDREESDLDPDIFASMLKAVGDFVKDSLSMMGKEGGTGLNSLGYENYKILVQVLGKLSLVTVIEGNESEFLIHDMKNTLAEIGNRFDDWAGEVDEAADVELNMSWFVTSRKYDGKFLVDNPQILQENLFDNVLLGLQRLSADNPLLLFLDDLQWADASTLAILHYLARNTRENSILLLGTYRPEDIIQRQDGSPHQLETMMQNMSREGLLERLELKRLGPEDTQKVIESMLGKISFDSAFLDKICLDTGGTPLFILELIKLLVEDGAIAQDEENWKLIIDIGKLDIPSKVYDVVKRRLDRLIKEQREILECASVVGEEFRSDLVGQTIGINRILLLKNLSEIEKSHRLIHSFQKKYVFDHAKVREVLYTEIIEELRQEYHRMVAETMVELHGDDPDEVVSELAHHYAEANDERAGRYLTMAADKARERYANDEAIRLYTRAIDFIGPVEQLDILEKLGDIEFMLGEYDKAKEYYERTKKKSADKATVARMLRKIGEFHTRRGSYEEALETFNEAREVHEDGAVESGRLLVSEGYTYYITGKYDRAMSLFLEALGMFEVSDAELIDMGNVLRAIGNIHYLKGEYEGALDYYEKSLDVMERIDDIQGISAALNNIGVVYNDWGNMDKALEFYEKSLEVVSNTGAKTFIAQALTNIGIVYNNTGELDKALGYMQRGLEIEEKLGDSRGIAESLNNIGVVYVDMGERVKALEYYLKSLEIRERIGEKRGMGFSYYNVGNNYAHKGEHEKAVEHYQKSLSLCQELGDASMAVYNHCGLTAVSIDQGDLQKALGYAEKAVETATKMDRNFESGMSRRVMGMVYREMKDWDKAGQEFEKALGSLNQVDMEKLLAETLYEYAIMHKAKGENGQAKKLFERSLSIFEKMGIVEWAEKCRKALGELN